MVARLVSGVAALMVAGAAWAEPEPARVFDLPSGRPTSILVTRTVEAPGEMASSASEMLRVLAGVVGTVEPTEWQRLRAMVRRAEAPESVEGAELVGVMHLSSGRSGGRASKRVEILRLADGSMVASEVDPLDAGGEAAAAVLPAEFAAVAGQWSRFRGVGGEVEAESDTPTPLARNVDMAHPYVPGWVTFDRETMGERFLDGRSTDRRGAARELESETLWVRLPAGYDPKTPAGMIVWIDPSDSGQPPAFMHATADALGLIIVGAAMSGNDRYIADRHQLQFDAIATAASRYHVDMTRVYASGVSGGGRVACMYWACFPEIFRGAVAVVGSSSYQVVPLGNGRYMERGFLLPSGSRDALRDHRIAAITGARDFNALEIRQTFDIYESDGFDGRVFAYEDMGHEYPTAERFREAMDWVDEPWRVAGEEAVGRARQMLDGYKRRREGQPVTTSERQALERITVIAPWSAEAWEAAELLGATDPVAAP